MLLLETLPYDHETFHELPLEQINSGLLLAAQSEHHEALEDNMSSFSLLIGQLGDTGAVEVLAGVNYRELQDNLNTQVISEIV